MQWTQTNIKIEVFKMKSVLSNVSLNTYFDQQNKRSFVEDSQEEK